MNRGSWNSGQDIVIFWEDFEGRSDNGGGGVRKRNAISHDSDPTYAPKLVITVVTGWSGKVDGVTDPAKVSGVAKANIGKVMGVA